MTGTTDVQPCPVCGRIWVCMTGTAAKIASLQKCRTCRGAGLVKGEPCPNTECLGGIVIVGGCCCEDETPWQDEPESTTETLDG
jgi:hypothetical protein